jgi:hypothetical protein
MYKVCSHETIFNFRFRYQIPNTPYMTEHDQAFTITPEISCKTSLIYALKFIKEWGGVYIFITARLAMWITDLPTRCLVTAHRLSRAITSINYSTKYFWKETLLFALNNFIHLLKDLYDCRNIKINVINNKLHFNPSMLQKSVQSENNRFIVKTFITNYKLWRTNHLHLGSDKQWDGLTFTTKKDYDVFTLPDKKLMYHKPISKPNTFIRHRLQFN